MPGPFRIAVLISGTGSNLQALIDDVHGADIEIAAVASSRADAQGLRRAERAGIETAVYAVGEGKDRSVAGQPATSRTADRSVAGQPATSRTADRLARDAALGDWLEQRGARLIVLAGWMELLGPAFIRRFAGAIVNVHPSLLPAFPGLRAIEQAVQYGVKTIGVTVHYVDEGVDSGAIILQEAIELPYPPRIAAIEERVHGVEHRLLPRAVRLIAEGRVRLDSDNPRLVLIDDVD